MQLLHHDAKTSEQLHSNVVLRGRFVFNISILIESASQTQLCRGLLASIYKHMCVWI